MSKITIMKNEADFAEVHQTFGGSSYSAALFDRGYADMPSAWSVWALFSGKLEDIGPDEETNVRVRLGKAIEPVIADEVAFKMGWDLIEGFEYHKPDSDIIDIMAHDETRIYVHHPDEALKMGCTVDRYIREHEDGPGIIECKNRDFMQWVENYTDDDASIKDQIQLAHQFACHPEIQWGAIAALVGGNDLKLYRYKRADLEDMIADVESRWRWLWAKVESQEEPTLTGGELPNWLRAHDEGLGRSEDALPINDDLVGDGLTFDQLAEELLDASARSKTYEKIAKTRKAQIVQHLQEHKFARSNRYKVRANYSKIPPSIVRFSAGFLKALVIALAEAGDAGDGETCNVINQIIAKGGFETRKGHTRVTLKFDEDAMTDQCGGEPSADTKKAAQDFQAPIE